jgi:bifunctional non-homologous end joining protein LigD
VYEGDELVGIGHVGGGFTVSSLKDIREKLEPLIRKECPLTVDPGCPVKKRGCVRGVTWVKPELVCEVALSGWTEDAVMRHPVFLRLREDKTSRQVVRERPLGTDS